MRVVGLVRVDAVPAVGEDDLRTEDGAFADSRQVAQITAVLYSSVLYMPSQRYFQWIKEYRRERTLFSRLITIARVADGEMSGVFGVVIVTRSVAGDDSKVGRGLGEFFTVVQPAVHPGHEPSPFFSFLEKRGLTSR